MSTAWLHRLPFSSSWEICVACNSHRNQTFFLCCQNISLIDNCMDFKRFSPNYPKTKKKASKNYLPTLAVTHYNTNLRHSPSLMARVFCIKLGASIRRRGVAPKMNREKQLFTFIIHDSLTRKVTDAALNQKSFRQCLFTFLAVRQAAHTGALNGCARFVDTPAVACGMPALNGLVVALLVTLRLVGPDLAGSRSCLFLAFALDQRDWGKEGVENIKALFGVIYLWLRGKVK